MGNDGAFASGGGTTNGGSTCTVIEIVALLTLVAVLDGAIWGDHCSPISDTTVLSSSATECGLMDHVRTQMPYAMLAMAVASLAGYGGYAVVWLNRRELPHRGGTFDKLFCFSDEKQ